MKPNPDNGSTQPNPCLDPAAEGLAGERLSANLARAGHEPLVAAKLAQAHRAARMQAVRADADLRAEPEFKAVVEAGARVPEDSRAVDPREEPVRCAPVPSDDRIAVRGP